MLQRSPFLYQAQYGLCAETQSYIALFLVSARAGCFALAQKTKKHTAKKTKTTYFLASAKSIIHGTKQMFQSPQQLSADYAIVPWAAGGLLSASLHRTVRYICWLGVGTFRGSYGTALRIASWLGFCAQHSAVAVVWRFPAGRLFSFAVTWWRRLDCCWLVAARSHCWHSWLWSKAAPAGNVLPCVHKHHTLVYRSVIFAVTAIL